jgi:uncharacterized membrane protein
MAFFILLISIWAVLWILSRLGVSSLNTHSSKGRLSFSISFMLVGILHIVKPEELSYMCEGILPYAVLIVYLTGAAEIILAILLLFPRYQKITAWVIIAYLIAVFPANINVALSNPPPGELPANPWYVWTRLLFQPVYILWVYYSEIKQRKNQN